MWDILLKCPAYKATRAKLLGAAGVAAVQAAEQEGWRRAEADNGIFKSNDAEKEANS